MGHQVCLQAGLQVSKRHSTGAARVIQKCKQAASPPQANGGMTSLCGRCLYSSSSGSGSGIFMSLKSFCAQYETCSPISTPSMTHQKQLGGWVKRQL